MPKSATRRYLVEVKDIKANSNVVLTAADWTGEEKQVAVAQVFRVTRRPAKGLLRAPRNHRKQGGKGKSIRKQWPTLLQLRLLLRAR
jgi:hypothetical protein